MRVEVTVSRDEINPSIVMLSSLCRNISEHTDVVVAGDELTSEDISKIRDNLRDYNVIVSKAADSEMGTGIALPVDIIVDGDIRDVLQGLDGSTVNVYDYALIAPKAHDEGMTYEDVKGKYIIIAFPEDKPWLCTNIHYDIEKIWWEYAKQTQVYQELMEMFLDSALSDTFLEDYAIRICAENDELRKAIGQLQDTVEKMKN